MPPRVVVLDHGAGDVGPVLAALQRVGADVELTADRAAAEAADGLVVAGTDRFATVVGALRAVRGDLIVERRIAGGRAVLGVGTGLQVMFERSTEDGAPGAEGLGEWPGTVEPLPVDAGTHPGWHAVTPSDGTVLLAGVEQERFYFSHPCGVRRWEFTDGSGERGRMRPPAVTWSGTPARFVAAVENGDLMATQFHPEESGDAGTQVLENWIRLL